MANGFFVFSLDLKIFNKKVNDFIIINAIDFVLLFFFLACVNVREGTIQTNIFGTGGDQHTNLVAHARVGGATAYTSRINKTTCIPSDNKTWKLLQFL